MSKGIVETIAGAALIIGGIAVAIFVPGGFVIAEAMITAGAGLVLTGVGTMLTKGPLVGVQTATRNPIAPWNIVYGRKRVGGTVLFINSFGDNDKYLDMVIVLAAHPCKSVDALLLDQQQIQIGSIHTTANGWAGTTFTPLQQDPPITSIQRVGSVVTVHLSQDIPLLKDGDQLIIQNVHPVNANLNGRFAVTVISHGGTNLIFSYVSGGTAISIPSFPGSETGDAHTTWLDYKSKVYMEVMLGTQTLGQTFTGLLSGTPYDGNWSDLQQNTANPWTDDCSLLGKTVVFLRLHYNDTVFANGIPQVSFLVSGKNDVYDPRSGTNIYTENAALCIADYIANKKWGFKAIYGTEIPNTPLIAAANICDEAVSLAVGGTEPRYTCNGGFELTMKRAEILQNLLTCCAGRLTYLGGQFVIWPGAWTGVTQSIGPIPSPVDPTIYSLLTGPFRWRPKVSISNLYNGVKGTYISPVNNWQSSDFPRYAQDSEHGYNAGTPGNDYDLNLDEDGGDRRWLDIQLPFTISCATAQRIGKIELLRRRQQGTGTFPMNMTGYQFAPMDVLALNLPYFGWAGKYLEIQATRFKLDRQNDGGAEAVLLGTEIDVQETDTSVYFWTFGEELSPAGYIQAIVSDTKVPAPPTNVLLSSDIGDIFVTWDAPADAFVLNGGHIEVEYQLVESPEGLWISLGKMDPTVVQATISNLISGDSYTVQIRSVNAAGVPSLWVVGSPFDTSPLTPGPITVVNFQETLGEWAPFQIQADPADALFPYEYTFDIAQSYMALANGSPQASVIATGKLPVNDFIPNCGSPEIPLANVSQVPTGGSIPGNITLFLQLCATDANGRYSPASAPITIDIVPGTNTNQVSMAGIIWPNIVGLTGYVVFASDRENLICGQQTGSMSGSIGAYHPTLITLGAPLARSTYAVPNQNTAKLKLKGRRLVHGGVIGAEVDSLTTSTVVSSETVDVTSADNWAGRVLAVIGRASGSAPYAHFNITAFDPLTGIFTLDRDPIAAGVQAGDVFVVCFLGYDNSSNPYNIADAGISNASDGHVGEAINDPNRIGNFILIIKGLSRGLSSKIVANGHTDYTISTPIVLDSTSVWIVVTAAWEDFSEVPVVNADPTKATQINMDVSNYDQLPILVGATTVDVNGNEAADGDGPIRMIWIFGDFGTPAPDGYVPLTIVSNQVTPDLTLGLNFKLIINQATQVVVKNPIGSVIIPGSWIAIYVLTDGTPGRLTPDFTDSAWGADVGQQIISGAANSRNSYQMTYHDDNLWHMDTPVVPA